MSDIQDTPEANRKYSSIWENDTIGTGHATSRINSSQGWSAETRTDKDWYNGDDHWIEVDLGSIKNVTGIKLQKRNSCCWDRTARSIQLFTKMWF